MAYDPKFTITAHLLKVIEEITSFREKILAAIIQVPWIPKLQKDSRVRNAHSSTAIEGNPLTLEETKILAEGGDLPDESERSKKEILNYFAAIQFVEKNSNKKIIEERDILKLQRLISKGVMDQGTPGEFRKIQVRVGDYLPPAATKVPYLMAELLDWWNEKSAKWSPVISAAIVHYQFEAIHPFADGNGRTGRALALWELYRRGFDTHHIFSVDEVYWEDRPRYYKALDDVRKQADDLTGWLEYTAEALHLTLEKVLSRVDKLCLSGGKKQMTLTSKQEKLLHLLKNKNGMFPKEIWAALDISKQGALDLMKPLIKAGLIRKVGTRKTGKYVLT